MIMVDYRWKSFKLQTLSQEEEDLGNSKGIRENKKEWKEAKKGEGREKYVKKIKTYENLNPLTTIATSNLKYSAIPYGLFF